MASITKRGAVWQVRVRRKGAPLVVRTFDLRADAEAWAGEIEREFRRGNIAALRQDAQRFTVTEVLDRYIAGPVAAMRSAKDITTRLERARARFGPLFLANVRGVEVAAWRDELRQDGLASQSVIHHLNALSAMFTFAEKDMSIDLPAGNPVAKVRKPQAPKARDRRLREPPRVWWRLQLLRRWSHEEVTEVQPRGPRARRAHGYRGPRRVPVAVGDDRIHRGQDRLHGADLVQLGAPART